MRVTRDVEVLEIEFPDEVFGGSEVREVAVIVGESEADLDDREAVNVGLEDSVVCGRSPEVGVGGGGGGIGAADDDTRELGVH